MSMMAALNNSALQAFAAASGMSVSSLSLSLRTVLLAGFFIWSAWCVIELMKHYKSHPHETIAGLLIDYVQLFVLVSVVITLVFI